MASCAMPGGCDDPACYLCRELPARFPKQPPSYDTDLKKNDRAELKESTPLPDLSAPGAAAIALAFRKRHRDGPFRGNA